ncbi:hypothetical protein SUGI_0451970 [Cryptomeria japonica]|nr:hypothetical protein SUGI_0451970 [Cryptomeria japonica]
MASEERQFEYERQRTECEVQKEVCKGCLVEGNLQQQTNDRKQGIADGKGKELPVDRQTKWRILEVDWNNQGPIHSLCNNNEIAEGKDNTPNQSPTEESNTPRLVEINLTEETVDDKCIWEDLAVIARIIGPKKSKQSINPWIKENWGDQVAVKFLPKGFFVAIFTEKGTRDQILSSKNWFFEKLPLYIQPWAPNFNPTKLAVYETPVWIRLFNLPIKYWGDQCLEKIGRTLGTLLEIDEEIIESDSYIYARMKIAAVEQIPSHIKLRTINGIWKQGIEIEKELFVCQRCGSKTHQAKRCRIFVHRAYNTKQRTEDKEKALWLKKINEQKQRPTAVNKSLPDASVCPVPNSQPCQIESEINNVERVAIPSQEMSPII